MQTPIALLKQEFQPEKLAILYCAMQQSSIGILISQLNFIQFSMQQRDQQQQMSFHRGRGL